MIRVVAVGKMNMSFFAKAVAEFEKRCKAYTKLEIISVNETKLINNEIEKVKTSEGKEILKKCKGKVVVLDLNGQSITSEKFASMIKNYNIQGFSDITFVIGGSYGLSEEVKSKADKMISFGGITYPHQLIRVVLVEQIYRAFSILNNSKYHK